MVGKLQTRSDGSPLLRWRPDTHPTKIDQEEATRKVTGRVPPNVKIVEPFLFLKQHPRIKEIDAKQIQAQQPTRQNNHDAYVAQFEEKFLEQLSDSQDLQARSVIQITAAQQQALDDNVDERVKALKKTRNANHLDAQDGLKHRTWEYMFAAAAVVSAIATIYFTLTSMGPSSEASKLQTQADQLADSNKKACEDLEKKISGLENRLKEIDKELADTQAKINETGVNLGNVSQLHKDKKHTLLGEQSRLKGELDDAKKALNDKKNFDPDLKKAAALRDQASKQKDASENLSKKAKAAREFTEACVLLKVIAGQQYDAKVQDNQFKRSVADAEVGKSVQEQMRLQQASKDALATADRLEADRRQALAAAGNK